MFHLTVGYVAGIIAAVLFLGRLWSPSAATFMLSGLLPEKTSAATLTLVGRSFQRSYWPLVLQGDSSYNHGAPKRIVWLSRFISLMSTLFAIAAIVTPLGLYEILALAEDVQAPFQHLNDSSSFGAGTPPRSNFSFNRVCLDLNGFFTGPVPCPFSDTVADITYFANGTINYNYPYGYDLSIPQVILDTYSSGTNNHTTMSGFFDIQWRQYLTTTYSLFNNGTRYLVGSFRSMESIVMNNAYQAIEGLVADTINGGIGFRSHTAPPGYQYGVQWVEDLLFIEPETVCIDTNLTLDFTIGSSFNSTVDESIVTNLVLTDRGGFSLMNHTYPEPDLRNPQQNPDLYGRAYKAAWLNNAYTALYYNVTDTSNNVTGAHAWSYVNSFLGKTFSLPSPTTGDQANSFLSLFVTTTFGDYLPFNIFGEGPPAESDSGIPTNPFNVSATEFDSIEILCSGAGGLDYANFTNIYVVCGMMYGVPQRQNEGSGLVFDDGSRWSQSLYSCASTVKATVKTVSFNYNGTRGFLQDLNITDIQDKSYADPSDMPLWGVENTGNAFGVAAINLIWGIVSSEYENNPNVSTVRQESLYLPGYFDGTAPLIIQSDNIPGSQFYSNALNVAYNVENGAVAPISPQVDYTGDTSMGMWTRWQNLSQSAQTASLIPNIIWTDSAASAVVGTKGVLGPMNSGQNVAPLQVTPTIQKIKYHYLFAIPALLTALGLIIITIGAFAIMPFGFGGLARLRRHLQHVSTGRVYTTFLYSESGAMEMKSEEWSEQMGAKLVDLSGEFPVAGDIPPGKIATANGSEDQSTEKDRFLSQEMERSEGHVDGSDLTQPQQSTVLRKPVSPPSESV